MLSKGKGGWVAGGGGDGWVAGGGGDGLYLRFPPKRTKFGTTVYLGLKKYNIF